MTPFATRFSRLTERQRYKTAIVATCICGALTGLGVGIGSSFLLGCFKADAGRRDGAIDGLGFGTLTGVMLLVRFRRLLMRYAPEDDAQPATQTLTDEYLDVTGGCAGECYGWRRYGDPNVGGCEKATCERLRQQPQPEPNQDTR